MEGYTVILLIVAIVILVFGGLAIFIPYLVKKGINVSGVLSGTADALDTAGVVVEGLQGFFPEIPAFSLIDRIIDYAKKATEAAEQLYKTSQIAAAQRKQAATDIVYDCLKIAEIDVTDDVRKIVNGCIEAAVFALPKTHENK